MKRILFILTFFVNDISAQTAKENKKPGASVQQQVWSITEVMYHDAVNPPAAARFYAYAMLTGYEILSQLDSSVATYQNALKNYPAIKTPVPSLVNKELAALYGILETGKNIIPSGYLLEEKQRQLLSASGMDLTAQVIDSSVSFAKAVSKLVIQYSRSDGYFGLSTKVRYKPLASAAYWKPTPPEYMAAVEPWWKTIRTFFS